MSPTTYTEQPQRSGLMVALVAGAIIALVAANIYLYVQIDHLRTDMAKMDESMKTEFSNLKDASSVTTASQQRHLETLKEELESARAQAQKLTSQAKVEMNAHAEQIARELQAEEAKQQQKVNAEIGEVKQSATAANAKIADVSTDVGGVKSQVSQTQADLQKTIADLKSVTGDLGVHSGLIATNASELAALRRMGERNYLDVKLDRKSKTPQKYGDVSFLLKKTDPKKNRYTVDVLVDDKVTPKENKTIHEPVQFYTSKGGHTPYELVINEVGKDQIVGYLSTPKDQVAR